MASVSHYDLRLDKSDGTNSGLSGVIRLSSGCAPDAVITCIDLRLLFPIGSIAALHEIGARWVIVALHQTVNCVVIQRTTVGEADFVNAAGIAVILVEVILHRGLIVAVAILDDQEIAVAVAV